MPAGTKLLLRRWVREKAGRASFDVDELAMLADDTLGDLLASL